MIIHHIGYLLKDIRRSIPEFEKLGYTVEVPTTHDEYRQADICFIKNGDYMIELISPTSEESVVWGLMRTKKNSPYHICYITDDFYAELNELAASGYTVASSPCPAPAIGGRRVAFLVNRHLGMIELVEGPQK